MPGDILAQSSRDPYGFLHVSFPSENPLKQEEIEAQPFKDFQIEQLKPSEYPLSIGAKILFFFEMIAKMILSLWFEVTPDVYQGLYENLLLSSGSNVINGEKESTVLRFVHHFLSRDPNTPKRALLELEQAAKWAEVLENRLMQPEEYRVKVALLAKDQELKKWRGLHHPRRALRDISDPKNGWRSLFFRALFPLSSNAPRLRVYFCRGQRKNKGRHLSRSYSGRYWE
jgi:hypothetical protein